MFASDLLFIEVDFKVFCKKKKDNKMCLFPLTGAVLIFDRLLIYIAIIHQAQNHVTFHLRQSSNIICLRQ